MPGKPHFVWAIICVFLLGGCALSPVTPSPNQKESALMHRGSHPVTSEHLFSNALRELSSYINNKQKKQLIVMVHPAGNNSGTRDLPVRITQEVEASLNLLSGRHFKVMRFDPIFRYQLGLARLPVIPVIYVSGAITRFDKDLEKRASDRELNLLLGGGKWKTGLDFNFERELSYSSVSTVFSLVDMRTGIIVPRMSRANTVQVYTLKARNEAGFAIYGNGAGMEGRLKMNQGLHQGVKNLIDYSLLQLFGSYFNFPYWQSLAGTTDQDVLTSLAKQFSSLNHRRQVLTVQQLLRFAFPHGLRSPDGRRFIRVKANGVIDAEASIFLQFYCREHGLAYDPYSLEPVYKKLLSSYHNSRG